MTLGEEVNKHLKMMLQHEFDLCNIHTGKSLRRGRFLLYTVKEFYMLLIFNNSKGERKQYNMPFPYKMTTNEQGGIRFDYTLDTLCYDRDSLVEKIKQVPKSRSPFYDSVIEMQSV